MQKSTAIAALMAVIIALSGCDQIAKGRSEIDKLFIARIMSIDELQNGKVKMTLTTKDISTVSGGQQQKQTGESIAAEGNTVFDAGRNMLIYSDRRPHYGHVEYLLFGEATARKGLLPYLDFAIRQNDLHFNAKIYVVKGDTAGSIVEKANTPAMFVGDRLMSIEENIKMTSISSIVTLNEAMLIFDNKNLATFIPFIELSDTTASEGQPDTYNLSMSGYAIFKGDKLIYFTSRDESRGINWLMGRIGSGIILVKDENNQDISLEIVDNNVKIIPRIEGNELRCTVDISLTTNIGEVMGSKNVIERDSIKYLTDQQEKAIKREVEYAIRQAQKNNTDHFSLISKFNMKYPLMRNYFKENWKDLFPDIKFDVRIESKIKGSYLINEPTGSSKEVDVE